MTRAEWKAFYHAIRADARAFKAQHGGGPCFGRYFWHNGAEIILTRYWEAPLPHKAGTHWATSLRASAIIDRPKASRHALALEWAADYRRQSKGYYARESAKRAARAMLDDCRALRAA